MTHLKPRSATKVLYQGDDMPRLAELKRAVDVAKWRLDNTEEQVAGQAAREGDDVAESVVAARKAYTDAQAAYDTAVDEAAERAIEVVIHDIGRRRFTNLVAAHPPREVDSEPDDKGETRKVTHPDDEGWDVNTETFGRALLVYRGEQGDEPGRFVTIAQPAFQSARDVEDFVDDELSDGDFSQLWQAAYFLNRGPSADPKAFVGSMSAFLSTDET